MNSWKHHLYNTYISTEQAGFQSLNPQEQFRSRKPYICTIIKKFVPANRSIQILDLACGHGAYLYFLTEAGYKNLEGIEVSSEQTQLANKLGISGVVHSDLVDYLTSCESENADVIFMIDILEHFTRDELFTTLTNVFRVLSPRGRCIAHVPNAEGIFGMRIRYGDLTHELSFTPQSIHQTFAAVGFQKISCYEDKPTVHNLKSLLRRWLWAIGTFYPRVLLMAETGQRKSILSQNMLVVAEKQL